MSSDAEFRQALAQVEGVAGWLSDDQARRLWNAVRDLPGPTTMVEIGSFRGRSAIVLALAAAEGSRLTAIDPHAGNDRGPREYAPDLKTGQADHDAFHANLDRCGVAERVRHVRLPSEAALDQVSETVDLLYIDGAHRYGPARQDIMRFSARLRPGGTMLIHDGFSSIGVTLALLRLLVFSRRFRYAGRTRSLVEYRRAEVAGGGRARNVARQLLQLPWFARNVVAKAALTLKVPGVARRLGVREWPY